MGDVQPIYRVRKEYGSRTEDSSFNRVSSNYAEHIRDHSSYDLVEEIMLRTPSLDVDFQDIIDAPVSLQVWSNDVLLRHFLEVRLIIMTETRISSSIDRISKSIQVGRLEYEEILRRMKVGHSDPPF